MFPYANILPDFQKLLFFLLDTGIPVEKSVVTCQNFQIQDVKNQTKQGISLSTRLVCYLSVITGFIYLHKFRSRDVEGKYKGVDTLVPLSPRMILNVVVIGQKNIVLAFLP